MYYDGNKRDMEYMIINEDGSSVRTFHNYTSCHNISYPKPINMMVRSLNHTAKFKVSGLSLNERLSDITGLRLVYDTLSRISWANQVPLPWLNLNVKQLFYLAFAQTHCTKLPLTSFYSPDYHIPSRMRIFVSASREPLLGNAWSCMPDTNVVPADTCPVFPKLLSG
ncbi:endothelin-converting enzyme-like 1 [Cephus cinctus]|uniref:Endothelin-converting enzyme-like 1 n=1 Tax=Cephus cinctus TaxID=211228 RepID=A0AAJ7R702_CEPCN|nr:endothelin-converting enzyme-like 1 [Cephus cinctus]XP_024935515.1 endothelin-converting enzyme-like 1 [Cephus cinctus]XP_024935516.1 endothelin-converting enzyme-like 1 [Cephus cinctus]